MYDSIADKIIAQYNIPVRSGFQGEWHVTVDITTENDQVHINTIFVPEQHRTNGIGKNIMNLIETEAIANNYKAIVLYAFPYSDGEGNTKGRIESLVKWYQSQGYELEYENDFEYWKENAEDKLYSFEDVVDIVGMYKEVC